MQYQFYSNKTEHAEITQEKWELKTFFYNNTLLQNYNLSDTNKRIATVIDTVMESLLTKQMMNWQVSKYRFYLCLCHCPRCINFSLSQKMFVSTQPEGHWNQPWTGTVCEAGHLFTLSLWPGTCLLTLTYYKLSR